MKKIDMSEDVILRRLKTVDQLRELCLALMKAKRISDEKPENESDQVQESGKRMAKDYERRF